MFTIIYHSTHAEHFMNVPEMWTIAVYEGKKKHCKNKIKDKKNAVLLQLQGI